MRAPLQIGITGGIGSGKSLICRIFASLGVPVYDADSHAKELMTTDGILVSQISKEFGDLSYQNDGTLNRAYLSESVFNNPERLKVLNALVHPRVAEDYKRWVLTQRNKPYVLKEAALLFEAGSYQSLDKIIVVVAPDDLRIKRVVARDRHRAAADVKAIMDKQLPEEEKQRRADYIIRNDEITPVIPQVLALHQRFLTALD